MKKKNLFISQVVNSIKSFDSYKEFSKHKVSSSFVYLLLLIVIYSIITTIGIVHNTHTSIQKAKNFIDSELSDIYYDDGNLSVNNDEYSTYYNNYVIIDTSDDSDIENYNANYVFGRTEFIINSEEGSVKFIYKNFITNSFDKNKIIELLNIDKYMVLVVIISFVGAFIVLFISTLLDILVIALIGLIISGFVGNNKIKFKNAFNISTHAITLSVILGMIYYIVNVYTGFFVKYFATMYALLATIYMMTAIILINTDESNKN